MTIVSRHKPPDSRLERKILTSMITSTEYLQRVRQIFTPNSLRLPYASIVAGWCVEFFNEFEQAPRQHIQDIFHKKSKVGLSTERADEIEEFLIDISEEYEADQADTNVPYLLGQTEEHFRLTALDNLRVNLNKAIVAGKPEDGEALIKGYNRVTTTVVNGVDPFTDSQLMRDALGENNQGDKIIQMPGELGELMGNLERGYLMSFLGNTGVGKTWWLLQLAWWGLLMGWDVLFVSFEMSQKKIAQRTYQWATGKVLPRHAGTVYVPVWDCVSNQKGQCELQNRENKITLTGNTDKVPLPQHALQGYMPCDACKGKSGYIPTTWFKPSEREALTEAEGIKFQNMIARGTGGRMGKFKVMQHPAKAIGIDDLKTQLQNLEDYDGFVPDIVITDYADKMKSTGFHREHRHGINEIWDEHKALAVEKNILVATASQDNTVRDGKDLRQGNWAESITKLHLCDVAVRINQKPLEKQAGYYRIGLAKLRDNDFSLIDEVMVTCCLKIGRPYLDSCRI